MKPGRAWAWAIKSGRNYRICSWAKATRRLLEKNGKPSTEAIAVPVLLIAFADWQNQAPGLAEAKREEEAHGN